MQRAPARGEPLPQPLRMRPGQLAVAPLTASRARWRRRRVAGWLAGHVANDQLSNQFEARRQLTLVSQDPVPAQVVECELEGVRNFSSCTRHSRLVISLRVDTPLRSPRLPGAQLPVNALQLL